MQIPEAVFLITGGASGLGAACAREIVRRGGISVIADRQATAAAQLAAELGPFAEGVACDVTDTASVQAAVASAQNRGVLRGVVCCAGILAAAKLVSSQGVHDLELFRRVVEVNLIGTFNTARLVAAAMRENQPNEQGERGVIVLTSSIAAEEGQIGQVAYAASKGGVASMVLPLARELGRHGIRVVGIAPGVFETPLVQAATEQARDSLKQQIPFPPRFGDPAEFASLVCQAIENPMLNGTVIRLDGGLRMAAK
jgi:NAD(P)-dependent dehydrogenase (short-subunit alcohol dehydrogenase family)